MKAEMDRSHSNRGLIVDLFAGGGGASTGVAAALGRDPDVALNHDELAMTVYKANHPGTLCLPEDVWKTPPRQVLKMRFMRKRFKGRAKVWVLWDSPDCTHFSKAKGGKPKSKGIRSLANVIVSWAREVTPSIIFMENVSEFLEWGPLYEAGHIMPDGRVLYEKGMLMADGTAAEKDDPLIGKPIPERKGEEFNRWRVELELLGYVLEWRVLDASQHGAPTRRKRLFIVARRDGEAIRWPEPTHGPKRLPYRTAAECIDWNIPCPSIFERKRPLKPKTLWRIAQGIKRYVIENPRPFIIGCGGRAGQTPPTPAESPVGTITAKNDRALVVPSLVKVNHGGMDARGEPLNAPLTTVTAQRRGHALVTPTIIRTDMHKSNSGCNYPVEDPLRTITSANGHALVAPTLIQTGYGERPGQAARALDLHRPLGTVMATGQKHALAVATFLAKHYGGVVGVPFDGRPLDTVTATDHHSLAAVTLAKFRGTDPSQPGACDIEEPLPTISAGGIHVAEVRAFLTAYYGEGSVGQNLDEPMRTVTALARLGLVTVAGIQHQIVDIGMRMLEPEELLRAQFGKYAEGYDLSAARSKAAKVRLIGNSVCPEMAEAVVRANVGGATASSKAA